MQKGIFRKGGLAKGVPFAAEQSAGGQSAKALRAWRAKVQAPGGSLAKGHRIKSRKIKGQVTTEFLLMAIVLVGLSHLAFQQIKNQGMFDNLVSGPNEMIANMLENGVWQRDRQAARERHPNHYNRHLTIDPY